VKKVLIICSCIWTTAFAGAESIHGVPSAPGWTYHGIIVDRGAPDAWDGSTGALIAGLTQKKDTYYMYYLRGFRGRWEPDRKGSHTSVGLATSTDGIHWSKHPDPVMIPHDFLDPVTSHEEGIRHGAIRYVPELGKFIAYLGIDVAAQPSTNSSPYRVFEQGRGDVEVDSHIYYAESDDGIHWSPKGRVEGAWNRPGDETTARAFLYHNGTYFLWAQKAQGRTELGQSIYVSSGTDPLRLDEKARLYAFKNSPLPNELNDVYLQPDGKTVTLLVKTETDWHEGGLALGTSSLTNLVEQGHWESFFPKAEKIWHGKIHHDAKQNRWLMVTVQNDLRDIVAYTAASPRSKDEL
jgi:hypothetical protein